jgi:hypothetical protein
MDDFLGNSTTNFVHSYNGDNLMHPPTYVCTHISVHKTIIEDNKLICNQSTKYFTIAKNNHYSNLDIDTIDHGKTIDYTTHHVCQEITIHHFCQEITVWMMKRCCTWWWRGASPRGRGGGPGEGDTGGGGGEGRTRHRQCGATWRWTALGDHHPSCLPSPWTFLEL